MLSTFGHGLYYEAHNKLQDYVSSGLAAIHRETRQGRPRH